MKRLERKFLEKMARTYSLSADQEEVFLLRFAEGMEYDEIIKRVNTSRGACLKRMGNVYDKFHIQGRSRGKETKLRNFLIEEYEKNKVTPNNIISGGNDNDTLMGGGGSDYLHGGNGDDTLDGNRKNERFYSGNYNDRDLDSPKQLAVASSHIFDKPPEGEITPTTNYPFYIERPPLEKIADQEIEKNGAFLRIKAPPKTGKTSLKLRILAQAKHQDNHIVNLDLKQADSKVLKDLDNFLQWICLNVSKQLNLIKLFTEFEWLELLGSISNCINYFDQLLSELEKPVVISFDCLEDIAFESPEIYPDFIKFLRNFYEQTKLNSDWQKLKIILVHSTSIYSSININCSPFYVGKEIFLPNFNQTQVNNLAYRYELNWDDKQEEKLRKLVEGQPFFVQLALYNLAINPSQSLESLIQEEVIINGGIYRQYLQSYLPSLGQDLNLLTEFKKVLNKDTYQINSQDILFKLHSLGLVELVGLNEVKIALPLYKKYFSKQLLN